MHFVKSKHVQNGSMIRRTMSSSMNLLLVASFVAAPASIVLLPTISFAAPIPFPPTWMLPILASLKSGKLTSNDIDILKKKGNNSYKTLVSIINRIDQLAVQHRLPFRLEIPDILPSIGPDTVALKVIVVDSKTGKQIGEYDLGPATEDLGPMKKTSLQAPIGMVSE